MSEPVVEIKNLEVSFKERDRRIKVVRGVSFNVFKGEVVGILGESGCGKTVSATSILRMEGEAAIRDAGSIFFKGEDLTDVHESVYRMIRGNRIAYVFQNASAALNPYKRIGSQLMSILKKHDLPAEKSSILNALIRVGLDDATTIFDMYPYQLSGGQNQRIMIAQGILCAPDLLIADEPTSSVDVALRKVILDVIKSLNREMGMAVLLITHDFEVVRYICDRVVVMYGGLVMEEGPMDQVLSEPKHPYTEALIKCASALRGDASEIYVLEGMPPAPTAFKDECPFASRCSYKTAACLEKIPEMIISKDRKVRCVLYRKESQDD